MNKSNGLKLALIVSLTLNLIVIGIGIGVFMGRGGPPGMHLRYALSELDGPTREEFKASMRDHFVETRALRQSLRVAQRELADTLAEEPFDAAKAEAGFANVRQSAGELQASMHGKILQNMNALSRDERLKVYRSLIKRGPAGTGPHDRPRKRAPAAPQSNPGNQMEALPGGAQSPE